MKVIAVLIACLVSVGSANMISKAPMVFSNWPPKPKAASSRPKLMVQIRSGTGGQSMFPPRMFYKRPPVMPMVTQRFVRPMKVTQIPHFMMKPNGPSLMAFQSKPPLTLTTASFSKTRFKSSPKGPYNGEYIFENPFPHTPKPQTTTTAYLTVTTKKKHNSPIHTIPAPNLSLQSGANSQFGGVSFITEQHDNHIFEKKQPEFVHTLRPATVHQYQVTESTNDHTITDPISGSKKFYAPDPDPSLPVAKIKPANDPFSQPSQTVNQPSIKTFGNLGFIGPNSAPVAAALVQEAPQEYIELSKDLAQNQISNSYTFPLSIQPQQQFQQHFLPQQAYLQGMPLSVYNPTYLVTQSNQLYDQHNKQRLFKPESALLDSQTNLLGSESVIQPNYDVRNVASAGQIYTATQDTINDIQNELSFQSLASGIQQPRYHQVIGTNGQLISEQPNLTNDQISDILNYGSLDSSNQQNFIASGYYQTMPNQHHGTVFDVDAHQKQNEAIINQAQQELEEQLLATTAQIHTDLESRHVIDGTEFDEPVSTVPANFESSPFRILVADPDYSSEESDFVYKRSDENSDQNKEINRSVRTNPNENLSTLEPITTTIPDASVKPKQQKDNSTRRGTETYKRRNEYSTKKSESTVNRIETSTMRNVL